MHEQVFAAVIRRDESETLRVVEPLHCACAHVCFLNKNYRKRRLPCGMVKEGKDYLMSAALAPRADQLFLSLRILPCHYTGAAGFRQSNQALA
jgi:hypothetical protein